MWRDETVIAAAENAEAEMFRYNKPGVRAKDWIGEDATWREVMLFNWARLRAEARRSCDGDIEFKAGTEVLRWRIA